MTDGGPSRTLNDERAAQLLHVARIEGPAARLRRTPVGVELTFLAERHPGFLDWLATDAAGHVYRLMREHERWAVIEEMIEDQPHEDGAARAPTDEATSDGMAQPAGQASFRRVVHPGQVLGEEIAALGLSLRVFAQLIGVPTSDVSRIVNGRRQLTARMALRLGHWFGTGPEFWLSLQAQYELALAERESGEAVQRLPTKASPLPPPRRTGRPPKRAQGDQAWSARPAEARARARVAAAALDHLTQGITLGEVTFTELQHHGDEDVTGRE